MVKYLRPIGVLNGVLVCDFTPSCSTVNTPTPKKRKRQEEGGAYIKKPPNAFMIFLKEQRAKVKAEMNISDNAAVNAVMGKRWKSLSWDQQAKYYQQADQEKRLHAQKYPNWSTKHNYGKKRKGSHSCTCSTASASKPGAIQPQRQASFGATGEDPLSVKHGPLLPATQDPLFPPSDPCTGPQVHQDSLPSTSVASERQPLEAIATDSYPVHADLSTIDLSLLYQ
ncbi:transcription factor 7-like 1-A [Archocentrus centrarchus]|uniref:transcription factor 7-like 1-A n=1 Tax=Archocentrus centrarchus TaxID=63155 RepID=UPI0011EA4A7A|nr:transcription factor 7-like 1-A [Archocentrus centrarchus]